MFVLYILCKNCMITIVNRKADFLQNVTRIANWNALVCTVSATFFDRVAFKLIVTVHRCLNGRAPNYLLNHVIRVSAIVSRQRLRSAQQNTLVVPRYRLTTYGRRAFSVAGPSAWNSLPVAFRDPTISDACFRRHLKTVLFAQQRRHHSV